MVGLTRPAIAGLLLACALTACKAKREGYASGSLDTSALARSMTGPDSNTPVRNALAAPLAWGGPSIIGFAEAANGGEVQLGKIGEKKATNPEVKAFARLMVTDHTAMLNDTKKLASKLKLVGDTATAMVRDMTTNAHDTMRELITSPVGADWDKNYMDKMVDGHQKALDALKNAESSTVDPELKQALDNAIAKVQMHLTKAQDVRSKLQ